MEMESCGVIPAAQLNSGNAMPVIGMGTASYPPGSPEEFKSAILRSIQLGYRHFDTAAMYGTEARLGDAIAEALRLGLVKSRDELFITSKLGCSDAYPGAVVPALGRALKELQLEYLDLYLIHWPLLLKQKENMFPIEKDDIMPIDLEPVWKEMEECQKLGLVKSIGVSNFTCKKLEQLLSTAEIPPAVNQVEMHPLWQQTRLVDFCKKKSIQVFAYSPLGATGTLWGTNQVMKNDVLRDIAMARGKTVAQISLRWIYQHGGNIIVKSFKNERMKENIDIFDWELSKEELYMISRIQQSKIVQGKEYIFETGLFKSLDELWDGEI